MKNKVAYISITIILMVLWSVANGLIAISNLDFRLSLSLYLIIFDVVGMLEWIIICFADGSKEKKRICNLIMSIVYFISFIASINMIGISGVNEEYKYIYYMLLFMVFIWFEFILGHIECYLTGESEEF